MWGQYDAGHAGVKRIGFPVFASRIGFSRPPRHRPDRDPPRSGSVTPVTARSPLFTPSFVLVWWSNLVQGMAFFLFVHFPVRLRDLGASEVQVGLVFGVAAFTSVLIRPIIGATMDRRGRRPVIIAGNALNVAVIALYLTVDSMGPWVYLVRVLHGLAAAMVFTSLFTYAADLVPEDRRTEGLALFGVSGMLTIALGGAVGDLVLGEAGDFDRLFLTALAFAAAALLLALPLREAMQVGEAPPARAFRAALLQRDLLPIWWVTGVFSVALTAYFTFLTTFVDETGLGSVAGFFAAYAGTAIVLRVAAGWLPDRVGPKRVLYPALAVFTAGFVVLGAATSDLQVALAGVLCGAGHGYAFPILFAFVVTRARSRNLGSASAVYSGLFDAGTLVAGPTLGAIIGSFGYQAMFFAAAGWVAVGTLVYAWWDGDIRSRPVAE